MADQAVLVTGAAGFIGFHIASRLLAQGRDVVGLDSLNNYYDPALKQARLNILRADPRFSFVHADLADRAAISELFARHRFAVVIHLAAQAGVRHSIDHPHAYVEANLEGFANVLEGCRHNQCGHLLYASSSSVYGANTKVPFSVDDKTDSPVSFYAATKKANELMAYSYSHLYHLPVTGLRFFTIYGSWGRPDMAIFLFTKAILDGAPIKLFNHGKMRRDFTHIDDVTRIVLRLIDHVPAGHRRCAGTDLQYRQSASGRPDACGGAAGEGIGPHGDQTDAADAARRCHGNLRRCRRPDERHRLEARDRDRGRHCEFCRVVSRPLQGLSARWTDELFH